MPSDPRKESGQTRPMRPASSPRQTKTTGPYSEVSCAPNTLASGCASTSISSARAACSRQAANARSICLASGGRAGCCCSFSLYCRCCCGAYSTCAVGMVSAEGWGEPDQDLRVAAWRGCLRPYLASCRLPSPSMVRHRTICSSRRRGTRRPWHRSPSKRTLRQQITTARTPTPARSVFRW